MAKITCPISGEVLQKSELLLGFDLSDVHPIFKAKKSLILTIDIMDKFQRAVSWREKKLYYLAVLNTTELVEFKVPANPEPYTMEYTMMNLITLATWIDFARHGIKEKIIFPKYIVREDNADLHNIASFISVLFDLRKMFLAKDRDSDLKRTLNDESQKIEIEFRKAGIIGQAFTRPLAKWALELTDTTEGVFKPWLDILQTPLKDAWCLDRKDILEIQEHLQAELPVNNDQAIAVLYQVKELLKAASAEIGDEEAEDYEENEQGLLVKAGKQKFPNRPAGYELILTEEDIPPKPLRSNFTTLAGFLQAEAKWDILVDSIRGGKKSEYRQF